MAEADSKNLLALLNGICRYDYFGDDDMTIDYLKREIYPDMPEDSFQPLVAKCRGYMKVPRLYGACICLCSYLLLYKCMIM